MKFYKNYKNSELSSLLLLIFGRELHCILVFMKKQCDITQRGHERRGEVIYTEERK